MAVDFWKCFRHGVDFGREVCREAELPLTPVAVLMAMRHELLRAVPYPLVWFETHLCVCSKVRGYEHQVYVVMSVLAVVEVSSY